MKDHPMQSQIDAALATASSTISKGGAVGAVGGWLFSSEFAAFCGVVIAALGFAASVYYNQRRDRREEEEHAARMKELTR
jgi:hypothetical protein